jgi:hypothetical protein
MFSEQFLPGFMAPEEDLITNHLRDLVPGLFSFDLFHAVLMAGGLKRGGF